MWSNNRVLNSKFDKYEILTNRLSVAIETSDIPWLAKYVNHKLTVC